MDGSCDYLACHSLKAIIIIAQKTYTHTHTHKQKNWHYSDYSLRGWLDELHYCVHQLPSPVSLWLVFRKLLLLSSPIVSHLHPIISSTFSAISLSPQSPHITLENALPSYFNECILTWQASWIQWLFSWWVSRWLLSTHGYSKDQAIAYGGRK